MEVRRRRLGGEHGDLVGQARVQRLGRALRRRAARHVHGRDLPQRVHACVGAARDGEAVERRERRRQRLAQRSLDRRQARLRRPPVERRAVVLDREPQPHVRRS